MPLHGFKMVVLGLLIWSHVWPQLAPKVPKTNVHRWQVL